MEVFYPKELSPPFASLPEIIWQPCDSLELLKSKCETSDIIIAGPGLGESAWGMMVWQWIRDLDNTMVIDAGGLSWLAKDRQVKKNWVITPHPGEASRLLDTDTLTIQKNRFQAIVDLEQKFKATVILKGSGSLVYSHGKSIAICPFGHSGMAIQGMGDALTGLIAGFLAQDLEPYEAACLATYLHAGAAEPWRGQPVRPSLILGYLQEHMQAILCKSPTI